MSERRARLLESLPDRSEQATLAKKQAQNEKLMFKQAMINVKYTSKKSNPRIKQCRLRYIAL